jgi:hypothetical protein
MNRAMARRLSRCGVALITASLIAGCNSAKPEQESGQMLVTYQDATTPAAQTKRDEVVAKVNAFEDIRKLLSEPEKLGTLDKKVKPTGVQGDVFEEEKIIKVLSSNLIEASNVEVSFDGSKFLSIFFH